MSLVVNTLAFNEAIQAGEQQVDQLQKLFDLNVMNVEVRREFFQDITHELPVLAAQARELGMSVYYSIPDMLFIANGELNPQMAEYIAEARMLGALAIKMNVGHFGGHEARQLAELRAILPDDIQLNVENDQTPLNDHVAPIKHFLTMAREAYLPINFVFDNANWVFQDENPISAARELAPFTTVLHLKNVVTTDDGYQVVAYHAGEIDWRQQLDILGHVQICLEYPVASVADLANDIANLKPALV